MKYDAAVGSSVQRPSTVVSATHISEEPAAALQVGVAVGAATHPMGLDGTPKLPGRSAVVLDAAQQALSERQARSAVRPLGVVPDVFAGLPDETMLGMARGIAKNCATEGRVFTLYVAQGHTHMDQAFKRAVTLAREFFGTRHQPGTQKPTFVLVPGTPSHDPQGHREELRMAQAQKGPILALHFDLKTDIPEVTASAVRL